MKRMRFTMALNEKRAGLSRALSYAIGLRWLQAISRDLIGPKRKRPQTRTAKQRQQSANTMPPLRNPNEIQA